MSSVYLKARDACIDNVRQYIHDAKKLMETGSYGHACALLILGREELAKGFIYYNIALDSSLDASVLIRDHTKTHIAHQFKLMQFSFLSALRKWTEKREYTPIAEFAETFTASEEGDADRSLEQHRYLREREKELNKLKMDALYVDINEGSVLSPSDSKFKEVASRLLTELEEILDFLLNVIFKKEVHY